MLAATTTAVVQAQDSSGFADVDPNSVHAPAINALAESGVIAGTECAEGQICPDEPFLRWTMAVWMIRALDLEPSSEPNSFSDIDPGEWWAPYVQRLSEIGVTKGCRTNPARYCPNRAVARAEMASFLARAFQLEAATDQPFTDVNTDDTHATNIAALAKSRITAGCKTNPNRYCPNRTVTNAEMASFLARATKQIPLPEQPTDDTLTAENPLVSDYELEDCTEVFAGRCDLDGVHFCYVIPDGWMECENQPSGDSCLYDDSNPLHFQGSVASGLQENTVTLLAGSTYRVETCLVDNDAFNGAAAAFSFYMVPLDGNHSSFTIADEEAVVAGEWESIIVIEPTSDDFSTVRFDMWITPVGHGIWTVRYILIG